MLETNEQIFLPSVLRENGDGNNPDVDDLDLSNYKRKEYIIGASGITDTFNFSLPGYMPDATYELIVNVYNSTGYVKCHNGSILP